MPAIAPGPYERQRCPGGHGRERRGDHHGPAHTGNHGERDPGCSRAHQASRAAAGSRASPASSRSWRSGRRTGAGGAAHPEPGATHRPPDEQQPEPQPERPAAAPISGCPPSELHEVEPGRGEPLRVRREPAGALEATAGRREHLRRLDHVPPSTRPGTATISRTRRRPSGSVPVCTTRSTLVATAGTTKSLVTFGPASSGSSAQLAIAARARSWRARCTCPGCRS